jgi:hypothetical protein
MGKLLSKWETLGEKHNGKAIGPSNPVNGLYNSEISIIITFNLMKAHFISLGKQW